jgi:diaminohydroxyphosphoribosylaminopyrimidine deaminase/5-amino-6-(5-phosphoribosylamino)uracil reductase
MSGISSRAGEVRRPLPQMHDIANMTLAIALGKRGLGQCWPNPSVGAVVADPVSGRVIACACTAPGGRPHAEAIALAEAGEAARGATLYVTLEPCSHWGKTPPCADTAIAAGIARLVYGVVDTDARVQGAGLAKLRNAGVEVVESALQSEARWLTLGHELRVTAWRPFVQIKQAVDVNGMVPAGDGAPVWVTGEAARARGHLLRAEADAILVGHGTVLADDPDLTCRLPGLAARSPVRVVLISDANLPAGAKMLATLDKAPVWVVCAPDAPQANIAQLRAAGAECITVEREAPGRLSLPAVLKALADRGITRLLVEGGPAMAASFFAAGLADEAVFFQAATELTGRAITPLAGLAQFANDERYSLAGNQCIGGDCMISYRRTEFWRASAPAD